MDLISVLVLALIQGILEWFPVSSSGHIILVEKLLGVVSSMSLGVALHFGTLMALFVYFRNDIVNIIRDITIGNWKTSYSKLGFLLMVASIPAALAGYYLRIVLNEVTGNFLILGLGWVVTGTVLFIGSSSNQKKKKFGFGKALIVGISQMFSLIPGVSRSGMTISSGLFLGLDEKESIRFSYLLAIPIILGANLVTFGNSQIPIELLWSTLVCFFIGLIVMNISFKYVLSNRKNLRWFGIYTLILGIVSIIVSLV